MPKRILAADHSRTIRRALALTFAKEPEIDITVVEDSQSLLACLKRERFDLLLIDYKLLDTNEMSLMQQISQQSNCSHVPVVLLVGRKYNSKADPPQEIRSVVRKPFISSELIEFVADLLQVSYQPIPPIASSHGRILDHHSEEAIEIDISIPTPSGGFPAHHSAIDFSSYATSASSSSISLSLIDATKDRTSADSQPLNPPPIPQSIASGSGSTVAPQLQVIDDYPNDQRISGSASHSLHAKSPYTPLPSSPTPSRIAYAPLSPLPHVYSQSQIGASGAQISGTEYIDSLMDSSSSNYNYLHDLNEPVFEYSPNKLQIEREDSSLYDLPEFGDYKFSPLDPVPPTHNHLPPPTMDFPVLPPTPYSYTQQSISDDEPKTHESLEVILGTPVGASAIMSEVMLRDIKEENSELLLPLEDDSYPDLPTPTPISMPTANNLRTPNPAKSAFDQSLHHTHIASKTSHLYNSNHWSDANVSPEDLDLTAIVPVIHKPKTGSASPPDVALHFTDLSDQALHSAINSATVCPTHHCQIVFNQALSLSSLSLLLQFADHIQQRLLSNELFTQDDQLFVNFAHKIGQSIVTLGNSNRLLSCTLPALLQAFGTINFDTIQTIAEQMQSYLADDNQSVLQRIALQTRLFSRPYASILRYRHHTFQTIGIDRIFIGLEQSTQSLYQHTALSANTEPDYLAVQQKLCDMLNDLFSINELDLMLEQEFSINLAQIAPLNMPSEDLFFALLLHFEQRGQLSELAEAIKEAHADFDTSPFDHYPNMPSEDG